MTSISDSSDLMTAEMGTRLIPKQMNIQVSSKHTPIKNTSPKFMTFIYPPKPKDPYEEGYGDYFEDLKEKIGIKEFQDGYRVGYRSGFEKAIKRVKK